MAFTFLITNEIELFHMLPIRISSSGAAIHISYQGSYCVICLFLFLKNTLVVYDNYTGGFIVTFAYIPAVFFFFGSTGA
jgi:hypothetical protein